MVTPNWHTVLTRSSWRPSRPVLGHEPEAWISFGAWPESRRGGSRLSSFLLHLFPRPPGAGDTGAPLRFVGEGGPGVKTRRARMLSSARLLDRHGRPRAHAHNLCSLAPTTDTSMRPRPHPSRPIGSARPGIGVGRGASMPLARPDEGRHDDAGLPDPREDSPCPKAPPLLGRPLRAPKGLGRVRWRGGGWHGWAGSGPR